MAERDHDGARERGGVDRRCRLEAPRVRKRVAQNQPAFRIGVDDFDRIPEVTLHNIAGLHSRARRQVFGRRNQADDIDLGLESSEDFERTEDRGGARLVELHVFHVQRRLDRNPAGIERHALADQGDRRSGAAAVFQDDEARFLGAALRDREERAHPFLLNLREIENRYTELVLLGALARLLSQVRRRAEVPRLHLQIASEQIPGRNRVADAPTRLGLVLVARIHDQLDRFEIGDRKSTRLNSSHRTISYAVFCLKKKNNIKHRPLETYKIIIKINYNY